MTSNANQEVIRKIKRCMDLSKSASDVLRAIKNMKFSQKFRERNFAFTLENKQIGNTKRNTGFNDSSSVELYAATGNKSQTLIG